MKRTIEIIPAILPKDWVELEDKVSSVKGLVKNVQVDICDGQFVRNTTWPYRKRDDTFEAMVEEKQGLPGWDVLDYEFDLMVNKPEEAVEQWVRIGASRIVIHAEAKGDISKAVNLIQDKVEIGIAVNIDTPLHTIEPYVHKIQFIQCMGINHIGFQGQEFDEKVIGKVREAGVTYPNLPVSVDGGVSLDNARELIAAGANRLVVGSAIFGSDNFVEAIQKFRSLRAS